MFFPTFLFSVCRHAIPDAPLFATKKKRFPRNFPYAKAAFSRFSAFYN